MKRLLNIQCFVKESVHPVFDTKNNPMLISVSKISQDTSEFPRVMHIHRDLMEFVLIAAGSSDFFIGDRSFTVKRGNLLIYNPGVIHDEVTGPQQKVAYYSMAVRGLRMPGLPENALIPPEIIPVFDVGEEINDLCAICEVIFRDLSGEVPGSASYCNLLMRALLEKILTIIRTIPVVKEDRENETGKYIKGYIDLHYAEHLTLDSMGSTLHISPSYLAHTFKEMTGYSPMQYLMKRRVGEAQTLLTTTDLPLSIISEMVGYESQSYFSTQFTRLVGMSPRKFRKEYVVRGDGERAEERTQG